MKKVVVEAVIGHIVKVTGTSQPVTGVTTGSSVITSLAFKNVRVIVERDGIRLIGLNPGGGNNYYTKAISSTSIVLNTVLVADESVYIQTIPR